MNDFLNNLKNKILDLNKDNKPILVIGNSPDILKNEYGELIDNNYFTIRFNKANNIVVRNKYKKYVGEKVDLKIYCSSYFLKNILNNLPKDNNIIVIPFGKGKEKKLINLKKDILVLTNKINNKFIVKSFNCDLDFNIGSSSSGLLMIIYLLKIFSNVTIYGFSSDTTHYFGINKEKKINHDYEFENKIIKYLIKKNMINYLTDP